MTLAAIAPTWVEHGACRGLDPLLFHPERGESTRDAKAVCATCEVRVECLTWALATDQKHGIFGGTSERERRRIRRRLAAGQPVPQLDPDHDATPRPAGRPPAVPTPTKEPAVDLAAAATEPAAVPTNGACAPHPNAGAAHRRLRQLRASATPRSGKDQRFHSKECAAPAPLVASPPGPVEALLGQLLAGASNWHVEADLGDVHVTVSRGRQ